MLQLQQTPIRGFLSSVGLSPRVLVEFQYNPTQISDKRSVNYATLNAPGLILPIRQYSQGGDRVISFTVRIDGLFPGSNGSLDNEVNKEKPKKKLDNEVVRKVAIALDKEGSIMPELNKYRAFLYPRMSPTNKNNDVWPKVTASFATHYAKLQQFTSPPTCRFGFGQDRVIDCIVTEISITELLFNAHLLPLRADVAVTLVELAPYEDKKTAISPSGGV